MDQKDVAEDVYEVNQELGVANRPPREKKLQIPGGVLWGEDIVTSKIEPCIIEEEKYFNGIAVALKISAFKFPWDDLSQLLSQKPYLSQRSNTSKERDPNPTAPTWRQ